jgi:4-aminobutyrate aminotransferase
MPLSAMVARAELMAWPPGAHGNTFGGNPVAVAASLATLELLEQELIDNAARIGDHMMDRMKSWPQRFTHAGDVRGLGLMLACELVKDKQSREPFPDLRDRVVQRAFERGVLILGAGTSSLRFSPPLTISKDQADFAMEVLEDCLNESTANA